MKNSKTTYRILLILGFLLLNIGLLFGIAQIIKYLNTGANRANMFHQNIEKERYYTPSITWDTIHNEGRPIEKITLNKIEQDYMDAWYARSLALRGQSVTEINNVYTERAKENILAIVAHNTSQNIRIETTTLEHNLDIDFYSEDGNVIILSDSNVNLYSATYKDDTFLFDTREIADFKIMMLLEDGFWRIRHLEKTAVHLPKEQALKTVKKIKNLTGINYYPQESPWDTFGSSFSTEILKKDFKLIQSLGLTTIRIFIGYEDFGGPNISHEKLEKLTLLLDQAHQENLNVILTLFDFYGDYQVSDWNNTKLHLKTIVNTVKGHPALHSWDLKNEPDLDFKSRDKHTVLAWLKEMQLSIKKIDPSMPTTIGWSSGIAAKNLVNEVDYVSFHHYQSLETLENEFIKLNEVTSKELVLQEFGMSTNKGFWSPIGNSEKDQYTYYKDFLLMQKRDSFHYLLWTLYDFNTIPSKVAGPYPWRKNKQAQFGLFGLGQKAKKALELFSKDSLR